MNKLKFKGKSVNVKGFNYGYVLMWSVIFLSCLYYETSESNVLCNHENIMYRYSTRIQTINISASNVIVL